MSSSTIGGRVTVGPGENGSVDLTVAGQSVSLTPREAQELADALDQAAVTDYDRQVHEEIVAAAKGRAASESTDPEPTAYDLEVWQEIVGGEDGSP